MKKKTSGRTLLNKSRDEWPEIEHVLKRSEKERSRKAMGKKWTTSGLTEREPLITPKSESSLKS
jgi:hypothetical protein